MASPPYAPIEEHIRGILQDVRLNPLERCAAIELYYHTDWNTRRLKCRGVIVAHIRRTIGRGETAAKKTRKRLEDLGFIQGDYFDASAWVHSEVTGPKTDPSENGPVRKQTRLKTDPSENGPVRKQTRPKTDPPPSENGPQYFSYFSFFSFSLKSKSTRHARERGETIFKRSFQSKAEQPLRSRE